MIHQARVVRIAQVLNMADNQVSGMVKLRGVPKLRALILTNNAITGVRGVPPRHGSASTTCAFADHRILMATLVLVQDWTSCQTSTHSSSRTTASRS